MSSQVDDSFRILHSPRDERAAELERQLWKAQLPDGAKRDGKVTVGWGEENSWPANDRLGLIRAWAEVHRRPRTEVSPNPFVGCVLLPARGPVRDPEGGRQGEIVGRTGSPGRDHAEAAAIHEAERMGIDLTGATAYVTLEPCSHHGRTPPCADALIEAGVTRVVVGIVDPDPNVAGAGIARLRAAGVKVTAAAGLGLHDVTEAISADLEAYLHHRRTGRPWVTLKLATSMDGRIAAPDRSSQWITGKAARADAHRLRAQHDAILVGAGTVRADDPRLTIRDSELDWAGDPRRVVLGRAPADAKVHPCLEESGPIGDVLDRLGAAGTTTLLVEGGATVARSFHEAGLVDRYVLYLAPALFGGSDGRPLFDGPGAATIADVWRGTVERVTLIGGDLRVEITPHRRARVPAPSPHPTEGTP